MKHLVFAFLFTVCISNDIYERKLDGNISDHLFVEIDKYHKSSKKFEMIYIFGPLLNHENGTYSVCTSFYGSFFSDANSHMFLVEEKNPNYLQIIEFKNPKCSVFVRKIKIKFGNISQSFINDSVYTLHREYPERFLSASNGGDYYFSTSYGNSGSCQEDSGFNSEFFRTRNKIIYGGENEFFFFQCNTTLAIIQIPLKSEILNVPFNMTEIRFLEESKCISHSHHSHKYECKKHEYLENIRKTILDKYPRFIANIHDKESCKDKDLLEQLEIKNGACFSVNKFNHVVYGDSLLYFGDFFPKLKLNESSVRQYFGDFPFGHRKTRIMITEAFNNFQCQAHDMAIMGKIISDPSCKKVKKYYDEYTVELNNSMIRSEKREFVAAISIDSCDEANDPKKLEKIFSRIILDEDFDYAEFFSDICYTSDFGFFDSRENEMSIRIREHCHENEIEYLIFKDSTSCDRRKDNNTKDGIRVKHYCINNVNLNNKAVLFTCLPYFCWGKSSYDSESCGKHGKCVGMDVCQCSGGWSGESCSKKPKKSIDDYIIFLGCGSVVFIFCFISVLIFSFCFYQSCQLNKKRDKETDMINFSDISERNNEDVDSFDHVDTCDTPLLSKNPQENYKAVDSDSECSDSTMDSTTTNPSLIIQKMKDIDDRDDCAGFEGKVANSDIHSHDLDEKVDSESYSRSSYSVILDESSNCDKTIIRLQNNKFRYMSEKEKQDDRQSVEDLKKNLRLFEMKNLKDLEEVGQGCFALVLKCHVQGVDGVFVLKIFKYLGYSLVERVEMSRFDNIKFSYHPNLVITLYRGNKKKIISKDFPQIARHFYRKKIITPVILMRYHRINLDDFKKRERKLCVKDVLWITHGLVLGVCHLFRRKIIHRDLHMQNILIDEEMGRVFICDFGLALDLRGSFDNDWKVKTVGLFKFDFDTTKNDMWTVGGKENILPPEVVKFYNSPPVDDVPIDYEKCDIYSVGVLGKKMLDIEDKEEVEGELEEEEEEEEGSGLFEELVEFFENLTKEKDDRYSVEVAFRIIEDLAKKYLFI